MRVLPLEPLLSVLGIGVTIVPAWSLQEMLGRADRGIHTVPVPGTRIVKSRVFSQVLPVP